MSIATAWRTSRSTLGISQDVQAYHPGWLDAATAELDLSWTGFPPRSDVLFGVFVVMLFVLGQRLAAAAEVVAAIGSGVLYLLLQQLVGQARPSADLVLLAGPIQLSGFPSGHLATFAAVFASSPTEACVHRLCGGHGLVGCSCY